MDIKTSLLFALLLITPLTKAETGFLNKYVKSDEYAFAYQLYVPDGYSAHAEPLPIILFLHGAGERGNNPLLATEVGIGSAIRREPKAFPALVIFPQCPSDLWWSSKECEERAMLSLEHVENDYHTDKSRVYLSGISMGGYGVWHLASEYRERWAALYPIAARAKPAGGHKPALGSIPDLYSGEALYEQTALAVNHLPVWIAHGGKDEVVPVTESRNIHRYLNQQGANVNYREYDNEWHNVWDTAYGDSESITWLFEQVKKQEGSVSVGQK